MFKKQADITVMLKENGEKIFFSEDVNLLEEPLFILAVIDGQHGTVEIRQNKAILHPANGEDKEISPDQIINMIEEHGEEFEL